MMEQVSQLLPYVYSLTLFVSLEALNIALLAFRLSTRRTDPGFLLVIPVLCVWGWLVFFVTTDDAFFDNTIGCNATNLLLVSFRLLLVERCTPATAANRAFSLAWHIRTSPRTLTPRRGAQGQDAPVHSRQDRLSFMRSRSFFLSLNLLCLDVVNDISRSDALATSSGLARKFSSLLLPVWLYCGLNCMYHPWSIISVGLGKSLPEEWPFLFNIVVLTKETWSVQLFWG